MDRFLLVDTADRIALVGIYEKDRPLAESRASVGRPGLEWVSRSIEDAERRSGISLRELDFLACGVGPGGFTSVRIGLSLMKALSQSLNLPMVEINRLEAAAMGYAVLHPESGDRHFFVRLPAAQNLEYAALFRIKNGGLPVCVRNPAALAPQKISGLRIPKSAIQVATQPDIFYPGLPRVAYLKASAGRFEPAAKILPLYLRGATLGPPRSSIRVARKRHLR